MRRRYAMVRLSWRRCIARKAATFSFAVACLAAALAPASSNAGTYVVTQTCGAWEPQNNAPVAVAIYTTCPSLALRNVGGPFHSTAGQEGRWTFSAPPGAAVLRASVWGGLTGLSGW